MLNVASPEGLLAPERRERALERFASLHSGREKPGRYWRIDLETIAPQPDAVESAGSVSFLNVPERATACDLQTAAREHTALLARAFGATRADETKFGSLAAAFARVGAFVYVPADFGCDEPLVVTYDVPAGTSVFPYTVVLAERGARVTVVERLTGGAGAFVCGVTEIVTEESASVTYATVQSLPPDAKVFATRAARPGRDAHVAWAVAELGAGLAVTDVSVEIEQPGVLGEFAGIFFANATQHVDLSSTMAHDVGGARSETAIKSAAVDRGQGRYLGNIRIAAHAQGSDASLRDDALLLSNHAHIDSVPALEIAANDVKAYHGATVGALDDDQIFYMESRGIERRAAERMIALGFFEPAVDRFPTESLRREIRDALEEKLP